MSEPTEADRVCDHSGSGLPFGIELAADCGTCRIRIYGELDLATRNEVISAAAESSSHPTLLIDIAEVSFMDCSGYGALVSARLACEATGRQAHITGWTGQPAHLRELISHLNGAKNC